MTLSTPSERMRRAIEGELYAMGVPAPVEFNETLLIRNGMFCGRKYQANGHLIVWFIEEDQLKIFGPSGDLLNSTSATECMTRNEQLSHYQSRRAA
jgi:hypothetical protein